MNAAQDHEAGFASFIVRPKRERVRTMLGNPKRRREMLTRLLRGNAWDPRAIVPLPRARISEDDVIRELLTRGAPREVYAISGDSEMDGRFVPLDETLRQLWRWDGGVFLSCIPGRLGCWRSEHAGTGPNTSHVFEVH